MPDAPTTIAAAMFGLLRFLVFWVVAVGVLITLVVQLLLPALVMAAINQSSVFTGQPVSIQVRTSLAGVLLRGQIDSISMSGTNLHEGSVQVDRMDATLADVGIVNRSFGAIAGSLSGVALATAGGGTLRFDTVELSGSSGGVTAVGTITPATLAATLAAVLQPLGVTPSQIHVDGDGVRIVLGGQAIVARLRLEGSTLVLDTGTKLGAIPILQTPADGTWALTAVDLSATGAQLTAVIRAGILPTI